MPRPNNDRPIADAAKVTVSAVILAPVALIAVLIVMVLIGWASSSPVVLIVFGIAALVWWTKRKESNATMAQLRAQTPPPLTLEQIRAKQDRIKETTAALVAARTAEEMDSAMEADRQARL